MKRITLILLAASAVFMTACIQVSEKSDQNSTDNSESASPAEEVKEEPQLNVDSLSTAIENYRNKVEMEISDPIEVSTNDLRAKIKQKWDRIHFYELNGELVRIKTYPYENISERTEEFYVKDGQLSLVIIEDDGSGERGKSEGSYDKAYYFHENELIKEEKNSGESEYSVKEGDAEELLAEFQEYLEIFKNRDSE
jgi:hypothetical protein